jgi:MFS family permease
MQAICAIAAMALLSRVPENYAPPSSRSTGSGRWIPPILIPPGIAVGFVNVQYPVVAGFLILHLQRSGSSGPMAFTAYAATILLSRFFLGGLPDRIHPAYTFYGGIALMGAGLVLIASGPSGALAVASGAILGLGFSFPWSAVATTVLRDIPADERGSAVGILSAFYDLFVGLSSFAAGFVAGHFGYPAAFLMSAVALMGAGIAGRYVFQSRTV